MQREWVINETDTIFIKRFKQIIQGETLAEVARKIKTSRSRVNFWIEGKLPETAALIAISNAYNVSIDWLCGVDIPRDETAYQRGYKDGYEKATKTVITALMEVQKQ